MNVLFETGGRDIAYAPWPVGLNEPDSLCFLFVSLGAPSLTVFVILLASAGVITPAMQSFSMRSNSLIFSSTLIRRVLMASSTLCKDCRLSTRSAIR